MLCAVTKLSKTKLGIKTAFSVVLIALIQGGLSFYRISVVLGTYGDEINGVVQVALQISAYLVLMQGGMSAAYQYKMYAPFANKEYNKVSALFAGLQRSMLKLSGKMILIALIIIPGYSALLINQGVGYWDTVLILLAIGIRITAPYFFTLPERVLIDIKEKKYIVILIEGTKDILTLATEILLILFTKLPLPIILCVGFVYLGIAKLIYLRLVRHYYGKSFSLKSLPEYASSKMTKAVYAHQAASIATGNTDNVVLSLLSGLRNVTIYSAFAGLIAYPHVVISRMIEGMRASLALRITRDDKGSYPAFKEMLAFSFFCVCVIVPVFLRLANPFVSLWIGQQYNIPWLPIILFSLILADRLIMPVIYAARDAKGLYEQSKKFTIAQAIVNVVLSVALVIPFGINGVLIGTIAALYFILQPFNFRLVYSTVFGRKLTIYYELAVVALICAASFFVCGFAIKGIVGENAWLVLAVKAAVCTAIATGISSVVLWSSNRGFRMFVKRFFIRRHALPDIGDSSEE